MKHLKLLVMVLVTLIAAPASAKSAAPPARATDHRATVIETSEGWIFGKAGAPVLIEYASFGCPHCGQFATGTSAKLGQLVKAGKLRFEFRPFLIFPHDRAATVLARCVTPGRRFDFITAVLLGQKVTEARLAAADADETQRGRLFAAELEGPAAQARVLAELSGLGDLARAHGLTAAAQGRCLAADVHQKWVTDADLTGRLNGVTGTPTYYWKGGKIALSTPEALLAVLAD